MKAGKSRLVILFIEEFLASPKLGVVSEPESHSTCSVCCRRSTIEMERWPRLLPFGEGPHRLRQDGSRLEIDVELSAIYIAGAVPPITPFSSRQRNGTYAATKKSSPKKNGCALFTASVLCSSALSIEDFDPRGTWCDAVLLSARQQRWPQNLAEPPVIDSPHRWHRLILPQRAVDLMLSLCQ